MTSDDPTVISQLTDALADADNKQPGAALAQTPIRTFWSADPDEMVAEVSRQATALAKVIDDQGLKTRIGNRYHINIEGWQTIGAMVGVFAVVVWSRPLYEDEGGVVGWEARAEARTLDNKIVGAAEAECRRSESTWKNRDSYAIRSMAQTRAMSKALRGPLGFIVALAGYTATPEEEMTAVMTPSANAKHYALTLALGDKTLAKTNYTAALEQVEIKGVRSEEDADKVIAALNEIVDESPFEEAEVVDDD